MLENYIPQKYSKGIEYTSLHFTTDYLKYKEGLSNNIKFNLSNNRTESAQLHKKMILDEIISVLVKYLLIKND